MTIEKAVQAVSRRLLASGIPMRRFAMAARLSENTVAKVAKASPKVTIETLRRVEDALDRIERSGSLEAASVAAAHADVAS